MVLTTSTVLISAFSELIPVIHGLVWVHLWIHHWKDYTNIVLVRFYPRHGHKISIIPRQPRKSEWQISKEHIMHLHRNLGHGLAEDELFGNLIPARNAAQAPWHPYLAKGNHLGPYGHERTGWLRRQLIDCDCGSTLSILRWLPNRDGRERW